MKILIVNIDRNYRSVYTGLIAACLLKKIPHLQISGLLSSGNQLLNTTGHFHHIHFIDTEDFFSKTKNLPSTEVEQEIKKVLVGLTGKWDAIINLSSNLLGSILVNFLEYKEVKGSFLDKNLSGLKFSDVSAFCLGRVTENVNNYIHFTYLYRSILKRFEEITLASSSGLGDLNELRTYFSGLMAQHGRSKLIFIDAGLCKSKRVSDIEFTSLLYQKINESKGHLPILFGEDLAEGHPLIKTIKENTKGEIFTIECQNEAQLAVIGTASLVITNNLFVKSVADLGNIPSILFTSELNLNDYSIVKGSYQMVTDSYSSDLAEVLPKLCDNLLLELEFNREDCAGLEIYRSNMKNQLPILEPVNTEGTPEYANWWLGHKFISKVYQLETLNPKLNKQYYKNAISKEQQILDKKSRDGIYSFALDLYGTEVGAKFFGDEAHLKTSLQQFFAAESSASESPMN